jgi:hypothetical protein
MDDPANATAIQAIAGISNAEQRARSAEQKADAAAREREWAEEKEEKMQDAAATVSSRDSRSRIKRV